MPNTRLNIALASHIVDDIKALFGPRGISQFLEEAALEKLAIVKKSAYRELIQGYQATAAETVMVLRKIDNAVTEERDV